MVIHTFLTMLLKILAIFMWKPKLYFTKNQWKSIKGVLDINLEISVKTVLFSLRQYGKTRSAICPFADLGCNYSRRYIKSWWSRTPNIDSTTNEYLVLQNRWCWRNCEIIRGSVIKKCHVFPIYNLSPKHRSLYFCENCF